MRTNPNSGKRTMKMTLSTAATCFLAALLALVPFRVSAFTPHPAVRPHTQLPIAASRNAPLLILQAGGFEWEDPTDAFDQGIENPFKNPDLMKSNEGMRIDPAKLLAPRLSGTNLYLIGMMGCRQDDGFANYCQT